MENIKKSIAELIGNTPLIELVNIEKDPRCLARLAVKAEYFNPAGSVKDRAALRMILDARRSGALADGGVIVEPTSGNTGIGLAAVGIPMGYRVILTMPDTMSAERRALLKAYGAEVVLTPGEKGMQGAIDKARELLDSVEGAFMPSQFSNPSNADAHYDSTGPEIYRDTDGKVDVFVCSVGTGGTLTGCARYLKEKLPGISVVAVEPAGSPMLSEGRSGPHKIQGIGAGFVPEVLDVSLIDTIMTVDDDSAYEGARQLAAKEGLLVGISSGAAFSAALKLSMKKENAGKLIVALLPDTGERYLSSGLFSSEE